MEQKRKKEIKLMQEKQNKSVKITTLKSLKM